MSCTVRASINGKNVFVKPFSTQIPFFFSKNRPDFHRLFHPNPYLQKSPHQNERETRCLSSIRHVICQAFFRLPPIPAVLLAPLNGSALYIEGPLAP